MKGHLGFFESKKPTPFNATTSIWMGYVPTCTCHNENEVGLSSAYFLLVPPTHA